MNIKKVSFVVEGHIASDLAEQTEIDADAEAKLATLDAAFQTFVDAAAAAGLVNLAAIRPWEPSRTGSGERGGSKLFEPTPAEPPPAPPAPEPPAEPEPVPQP